jgi:hypothetical protein
MADFYFTIVGSILNIVIPYLITRHDRRRLDAAQLERAWNGPSWACAVYFFGPLCLPAHFWVTRRTLFGFLQGVAWTIAVFGSEYLVGLGLESVLGES